MDAQRTNPILKETLDQVYMILGSRLDSLYVERAAIGLFFSGVKLSNGAGGIAGTPLGSIWRENSRLDCACGTALAGNLRGSPVSRFLENLDSGDTLCRLLALAALNALTRSCREGLYDGAPGAHIGLGCFDDPEFPAGGKTVIIGRGVSVPRPVLDKADSVTVLHTLADELCDEQRPFFASVEQAEAHLAEADLIIITGHTLCDGDLADYIGLARPEAVTVAADPSIGLLPDPFFARGVKAVSTAVVTRPDHCLDCIAQGGSVAQLVGHSVERALMLNPAIKRRASLWDTGVKGADGERRKAS